MFWTDFVRKEAREKTGLSKMFFKIVRQLSPDKKYDFSPSYISMTLSSTGSSESHLVFIEASTCL
jgi:hypothetical protein